MIVVTCHTFAIVAITLSRVTIRRRITDRRQYSHRTLYRFCHVQKKISENTVFTTAQFFFVLQCNRDSMTALSWKSVKVTFVLSARWRILSTFAITTFTTVTTAQNSRRGQRVGPAHHVLHPKTVSSCLRTIARYCHRLDDYCSRATCTFANYYRLRYIGPYFLVRTSYFRRCQLQTHSDPPTNNESCGKPFKSTHERLLCLFTGSWCKIAGIFGNDTNRVCNRFRIQA